MDFLVSLLGEVKSWGSVPKNESKGLKKRCFKWARVIICRPNSKPTAVEAVERSRLDLDLDLHPSIHQVATKKNSYEVEVDVELKSEFDLDLGLDLPTSIRYPQKKG